MRYGARPSLAILTIPTCSGGGRSRLVPTSRGHIRFDEDDAEVGASDGDQRSGTAAGAQDSVRVVSAVVAQQQSARPSLESPATSTHAPQRQDSQARGGPARTTATLSSAGSGATGVEPPLRQSTREPRRSGPAGGVEAKCGPGHGAGLSHGRPVPGADWPTCHPRQAKGERLRALDGGKETEREEESGSRWTTGRGGVGYSRRGCTRRACLEATVTSFVSPK